MTCEPCNRSFALAMIPPGNCLRLLRDFRKTIKTLSNNYSALAYFEFPVLSWFMEPMETNVFLDTAKSIRASCIFDSLTIVHGEVFLQFESLPRLRESPYCGPFQAGIGVFCMNNCESSVFEQLQALSIPKIKSKTWEIAQIEMHWGSNFQCFWKILQSVRNSKIRL